MQRLFSSFPDGRPGAGLLLLRLAGSLAMIVQAREWLGGTDGTPWRMIVGSIAIVTAASLLAGFMTPLGGAMAAAVSLFGTGAPAMMYVFAIATAIFLLGPGAFSVDARLFGRREIVIEN